MADLPETQNAVQLTGPDELVLNHEKPVHRPGPHQIVGRVRVVGLCFSDLKLLKQFDKHVRKSEVVEGIDPAVLAENPAYVPGDKPAVPGHEPVIEVLEVGSEVSGVRPGERYVIQADWRWLRTGQSNGAFGYNFEGALQEYVLLDQRLLRSPEGDSMLLPATPSDYSDSAFALVEPWACVEISYRERQRRRMHAGGRALVVCGRDRDPGDLDAFFEHYGRPEEIVRVENRDALEKLEDGGFDDLLYFGADAELVPLLFDKARKDALILIVQCGEKFGAPVKTAVGAVHYRGLRLAGTPGSDPAEALAAIPENGEPPARARARIVGAAGPMGTMHVVRLLSMGEEVTVHAEDLERERLDALTKVAAPVAEERGNRFEAYNPREEDRGAETEYELQVTTVPVPALVEEAVQKAARGGLINIFAGIPADKSGQIDLDRYIERGLYFIGTSGSEMEDMRAVLDHVAEGRLDTNTSVAAVCGLDGAIDGIRAVEHRTIAGKIMVYPACRGMQLTPLEQLDRVSPEAAKALQGGVWNREAEEALIRTFEG
ncbi:alcohol dehydrogenase catalytic domain-containing protein [Kiritimatiella glycovorans]|uniref:L-threonine 3-dehydrogenase n=1 Tax=Kiritimatiella glycovorans TaxID=1307763 RepID=A0A0G3EGJ3_9BACT|nr:alcohol dehydrogenase catalytic domain-containing protein [Kiritimatiella glycovorans]AKJ64532.1 L-threonine 3-dehydrogenase [Kiritimatiella glycovorans]